MATNRYTIWRYTHGKVTAVSLTILRSLRGAKKKVFEIGAQIPQADAVMEKSESEEFTLEGFSSIIVMVVMLGALYFIMIRPENKRKKQIAEMRSSLKVGDDITTIGGITGTICALKENTLVIESGADRVRLEITKWAVSTKGTQTSEDADPTAEPEKKDKKGREK